MTSIGTLRELDLAVEQAFDVACDYPAHERYGSGAAILYGIQIPVKECGCPGRTSAYCAGCVAALQSAASQGRPGWCYLCFAEWVLPSISAIARWEPIR